MSRYSSPELLQSELIRNLYQWWMLHSHGDIPDRSDLDPSELRRLLPNMVISDVELDPLRIRYRLVGTKVVEATGLDFTGHYLDELTPGDPDEPGMDDYRIAYETRRPVFGVSNLKVGLGAQYLYEFGMLPLRAGGHSIAQFIGIEDYFEFGRLHRELEPWTLKGNTSDV